jgi:hypothetical protein
MLTFTILRTSSSTPSFCALRGSRNNQQSQVVLLVKSCLQRILSCGGCVISQIKGGSAPYRYFTLSFSTSSPFAEIQSPPCLQMLRTFNINTSPEEYASLLARYDPNNDGVIDYYEFVDKLMPPEFETKKQVSAGWARLLSGSLSSRNESRRS